MWRRLGFFIAWLAPLWSLACDASGGLSYTKKHLFIQNCDEQDDPTGYWKAVREAATRSINFDSVECVDSKEDASRSIDGILSSMPAPGEGRVALVRSLREQPNTDAEFARAVRAGVSLFTFLEMFPFQSEANNVTEEDHLILHFASAYTGGMVGGRLIGKEWCRIAGNLPQRVAVYYSHKTALDYRVDKAVEMFATACPGTYLKVSHRLRGNLTEAAAQRMFEKLFVVDKAITAVVCVNDNSAVGVIKAADKFLSASQARSMVVTGFGHREVGIPYLNRKRLAVTVDEQLSIPNKGVWEIMPQVMDKIGELGITNNLEFQTEFTFSNGEIPSTMAAFTADREGYISDSVMYQYRKEVRAIPEDGEGVTVVKVGLFSCNVLEIDPDGFEATFWITVRWHDVRLSWDSQLYNGTLRRGPGELWEPYVYVANMISSSANAVISETASTIESDGTVSKALKYTTRLVCAMNNAPFPFDTHECSIEVSAGSSDDFILLEPGGMELDAIPESYKAEIVGAEKVQLRTPLGLDQSSVSFQMIFIHDPSYVSTTFITVAWALNLVSFGQFWIPPAEGNMDRCGLAITTILASTVLQAEARGSKVTSWLDVFFSISIAFQFISFFASVLNVHYMYDLDYDSENLQIQRQLATAEEVVGDALKDDKLTPKSRFAAWNTMQNEIPLTRHQQRLLTYIKFTRSILGDRYDILPDRWGRRYIVPSFLLIMTVLPFYPSSGDMSITSHKGSGVNSVLFQLSGSFLAAWAVIPVSLAIEKLAMAACLPRLHDDKRSSQALTLRRILSRKVRERATVLIPGPRSGLTSAAGSTRSVEAIDRITAFGTSQDSVF